MEILYHGCSKGALPKGNWASLVSSLKTFPFSAKTLKVSSGNQRSFLDAKQKLPTKGPGVSHPVTVYLSVVEIYGLCSSHLPPASESSGEWLSWTSTRPGFESCTRNTAGRCQVAIQVPCSEMGWERADPKPRKGREERREKDQPDVAFEAP